MLARRLIRGVLPAALIVLAACGSDDEESSSTTGAPATTEAPASSAETTAAPSDTAAAGDTTPGEPQGAPDANPCAEGQSGDLFPTTPPAADATPLTVVAQDYNFSGLDVDGVGNYALSLDNQGEELHEIVVVRINDDETRTVAELLQIPDPSSFSTTVAMGFACPGTTSEPTALNIEQPGRYVAVCFIPVGAKPDTEPAAFETLGPPHAMEGMVTEFTVDA